MRAEITKQLRPLQDLVSGFDFGTVILKYYEGFQQHNEELQGHALRWLRGEYATKTEAREALGVRTIIDDSMVYDYLKLWAGFVRLAGYKGLLVSIDELVVLSHRLSNSVTRNKNYEALLRIINDCLQGRAQGIAFIFAGTDECIEDRRRGLFSYEALATRLAGNRFATDGRQDWSSPVIKLQNLRPEDCFVLLHNLRNVFAEGDPSKYLVPDEAIAAYLRDCNKRLGAAYFQTPRDSVKDFINLLNMLAQDRSLTWQSLLSAKSFVTPSSQSNETPEEADESFTEFKL